MVTRQSLDRETSLLKLTDSFDEESNYIPGVKSVHGI